MFAIRTKFHKGGVTSRTATGILFSRRKNVRALFLMVGFLSLISVSAAQAEEQRTIDSDYIGEPGGWRYVITPYALLASQSTDVGGTSLRQSFDDLSSMINFGFQLAAEVRYERWALTFDGTYADLGASSAQSILEVNLDLKQYMADFRGGYTVVNRVDYEDDRSVVRGWAMDVNLGAKYWQNDVDLGFRIPIGDSGLGLSDAFETTERWWDPMVGIRARIILSQWVLLGIQGSIGGFGIGNASDLSTDFLYVNTFKVSNLISVTAGFRSFRYDRTDGEGEDELKTTVLVLGPLLGASFVF
jgi:hypothetical protein